MNKIWLLFLGLCFFTVSRINMASGNFNSFWVIIYIAGPVFVFIFSLYNKGGIRIGYSILSVGAMMNMLVITLNKGLMPLSPESQIEMYGFLPPEPGIIYRYWDADTRLRILSDWINIGIATLSPGDILLFISVIIVLFPSKAKK